MRRTMTAVSCLMLLGCDGGVPQAKSPRTTPTPQASEKSPQPDPEAKKTDAKEIVERAKAAVKLAFEAVTLDGSSDTLKTFRESKDACDKVEDPRPEPALVPYLARCAIMLLQSSMKSDDPDVIMAAEPKVAKAEQLVSIAMSGAKKAATAHADAATAASAQDEAIEKARKACGNPAACKAKCGSGAEDAAIYCFVYADKVAREGKLDEATAPMEKACGKAVKGACEAKKQLDEAKAEAGASKASSFSDTASIADDIAGKMFVASTAAKMGGRAARQVGMMRLVIAAAVKERFCPAKKEAVTAIGAREFAKLAATHCKDDPPSATGLSGADVTLAAECRSVFASTCP